MYQPPYKITHKIIEYISLISEKLGILGTYQNNIFDVKLRKENRIKTIHSSLAIENNNLSIEQITAILNGKKVIGDKKEIIEVENAILVYDKLLSLNPYKEKDLLNAHKLMMKGLVNECGKYRSGGVGIFDGKNVIHIAPKANMVPLLMSDLFEWIKNSNEHLLIKSCVFHYEFEFIHPFQDGNGRMGRLWQTVILKHWKEIFAFIPIETLIKENQDKYYKILRACDKNGDSTKFIEFMLSLILETVNNIINTNNKKVTAKVTVKVTANQKKILDNIRLNPYISQDELSKIVGIAKKNIVLNMKKMKDKKMIERVGADKNGYWKVIE